MSNKWVTIYIIDKVIVTGEEVERGSRDIDWISINSDDNVVKKMTSELIAMFPERLSFNVLTKIIKVEKRNTFPVNYRFTLDAHGFTSMRYEVIAFKEPMRKDLTVTETKITPLVSCSTVSTTSTLMKEIQDAASTSLENQKSSTIMKEKQGTAYTSLADLLSPAMMRKKTKCSGRQELVGRSTTVA